MDHHVVTQQTHARTALNRALSDTAASHLAHLGDVEHFQDLCITNEGFASFRRQKAGHSRLHIIHKIVDHVVIADLNASRFRGIARLLVGPHVKRHNRRIRGFCQRHVRLGDAAHARVDDPCAHLIGGDFFQGANNGLGRALHVRLDKERELFEIRGFEITHHLLKRAARACLPRHSLFALLAFAIVSNLTRPRFAFHHGKGVACERRAVKAQNLNGHGRPSFRNLLACVRHQGAHPRIFRASHHNVALLQRAALNENRCHWPAALVELGFHHNPVCRTLGIGLKLENFRLQQDLVEKSIKIDLLQC